MVIVIVIAITIAIIADTVVPTDIEPPARCAVEQ
jgi:hypothetical protein